MLNLRFSTYSDHPSSHCNIYARSARNQTHEYVLNFDTSENENHKINSKENTTQIATNSIAKKEKKNAIMKQIIV
jgi:antibiotic biosynthesis monooxygenase (ABM) superfamily enzyme